jgi:predicted methyltransferase
MNRRQFSLSASMLALGASPLARATELHSVGPPPPTGPSPLLLEVIRENQRSAANRARDPFRHPAQSLTFWGLAPGMIVVEVEPSGGYWTEILARYLALSRGHYIAAVAGDPTAFRAKFSDAAHWGQITVVPFDGLSGPLAESGSADMVLTARNFHNWMWRPGLVEKFLADFHAALKPQGILAVEEHRADPRPMIDKATDGYVSSAYLERKVELGGFELEASSEINANPKDGKDYPFGVWTLPPTRQTHLKGQPTPADFDPAKYEAIGESDRMTLRFRRI